jgi:hypothetical protein
MSKIVMKNIVSLLVARIAFVASIHAERLPPIWVSYPDEAACAELVGAYDDFVVALASQYEAMTESGDEGASIAWYEGQTIEFVKIQLYITAFLADMYADALDNDWCGKQVEHEFNEQWYLMTSLLASDEVDGYAVREAMSILAQRLGYDYDHLLALASNVE